MKENQITLINDDGSEELAEILFTHEYNDLKYVIFEILSTNEVSAAKFEEGTDGMGKLMAIETDEEWQMLEEVLEKFYDELEDFEEDELFED